eukprot:4395193-Alexandrium_andersonii.AAC.1
MHCIVRHCSAGSSDEAIVRINSPSVRACMRACPAFGARCFQMFCLGGAPAQSGSSQDPCCACFACAMQTHQARIS